MSLPSIGTLIVATLTGATANVALEYGVFPVLSRSRASLPMGDIDYISYFDPMGATYTEVAVRGAIFGGVLITTGSLLGLINVSAGPTLRPALAMVPGI